MKDKKDKRIVCWFSCGAASAVATKLAIKKYGVDNLVIGYQDTGSEHPDNMRFLKDCEKWFGLPIEIMRSDKYKDIWDVFSKRKYIVGIAGAPCTAELKRKVAENFLNFGTDTEIFGYTVEEKHRVERFREQNPERNIACPLIDEGYDKDNCKQILMENGLKIPEAYTWYENANCIGCVKGGTNYWMRVRKFHPDVFNRMAVLEREIGAAICKKYVNGERQRVFLDELPEGEGDLSLEKPIQCGLFCGTNLE
jgi:3'-phosphoadenosine 5'-phosphosulfate sulfotransferase (PAPS reductase)/FAD synthetase